MPRKFFRKYLPSHESIRQNRYIARFGTLLHHPNPWHLNRHSVAGGVAIGMFSGLVPGPLQMLTAAILAVPLRVNLPVALATTLYTNPLTIGPLYVIAYWIGTLFVPGDGAPFSHPPGFDWSNLRSEEHTSELQSRRDLVCRLLLEKKKKTRPTLPSPSPDTRTSGT